ncbi:CST complex subunit STN1 [Borealophlyctis nickersoniae]|nr:CST complex subunit STN1 [Borealophlyctis nickersoniae]
MGESLPTSFLGLDPLFWVHCKLLARDILDLTPVPELSDVYYLYTHPVRKVELTGLIVRKDESSNFVSYTVDDGTGAVPCIYWFPEDQRFVSSRATCKLGELVRVMGRITDFRGSRQITINNITTEADPNVELLRWIEALELRENVYRQPFTISNSYRQQVLNLPSAAAADENGQLTPCVPSFEEELSKLQTAAVVEEDLKDMIRIYFLSNDIKALQYLQIRDAPVFIDLARRILLHSKNVISPSTQQISTLFTRAMWRLVKEGVLYVDKDTDVYTVIEHDLNLGPAILGIVQEETMALTQLDGGVPQEFIILRLRDKYRNKFKHVPRKAVIQSLGKLVSSSDIYDVGKGEYRSL